MLVQESNRYLRLRQRERSLTVGTQQQEEPRDKEPTTAVPHMSSTRQRLGPSLRTFWRLMQEWPSQTPHVLSWPSVPTPAKGTRTSNHVVKAPWKQAVPYTPPELRQHCRLETGQSSTGWWGWGRKKRPDNNYAKRETSIVRMGDKSKRATSSRK